jgi:hypothetical protein
LEQELAASGELAATMKKLSFYIIFLLVQASLTSRSQTYSRVVNNWMHRDVPTNQDTVYSYNLSDTNWIVYHKNATILARQMGDTIDRDNLPFKTPVPKTYSKMEEFSGKRSFIKVHDGYLVAFWRGEFGASLFWFSNDGTNYYKITGASAVQFISRHGEIYAINGLAHLNMSTGRIFKITQNNDKWVAQNYLELPFAPYTVSLDSNNDFIVVTSDNLIKVNKKKKIKTILSTDFWQGLYPTSSVINGDNIYIGMRKGVYLFNFRTKKSKWLLPK